MKLRGVMVVEEESGQTSSGPLHALWHVANRPIAHHVIDGFKAASVDELLVVTSGGVTASMLESLTEPLRASAIRVRHVVNSGRCDVPAALRLVAPLVGDAHCIVHTATGLLGESLGPLMGRLRSNAPDATAFIHQGTPKPGRLSRATREMLHLAEFDPEESALGLAGVWIFGPSAMHLLAEASWQSGSCVDLTEVAQRITGSNGRFEVRPVDAWCSYEGDTLDLLELNRIALDKLQTQLRPRFGCGNRIEGRVVISERASVRSSVVVGPTVIGPGATIADAYIGPYTSVGAGARIEGAEIERSIISADASILHIGERIVSSVLGRDARVFRDFSLPRALRLRVGDGTEIALS